MSAITFDTLKYTKELERSGVDPRQAEDQANALSSALSEALETQLATKSDIADLKSEITRVDGRLNLKCLCTNLLFHDKLQNGALRITSRVC